MIRIQYDCPEEMEKMEASSCGFYCSSCKHEVMDFRGLSHEEIQKKRMENPNVHCGVFDSDKAVAYTRTWISNTFRLAFAAIFVLGLNASALFSQSVTDLPQHQVVEYRVENMTSITGTVLDHNWKSHQARISYSVDGVEIGSFETGPEGKFDFDLSKEHLGKSFVMSIYVKGFYHQYVRIDALEKQCYLMTVEMVKVRRRIMFRRNIRGRFH